MNVDLTLDPVLDRPSASVAAMAAMAAPPAQPVVVPLGLQLVDAAERYERLLREAQARHDELEIRIARLELHEADVRRRCEEAHAEHAVITSELAELAGAGDDWPDWAFVDPIAAPAQEEQRLST
jgi:hypothetical protein